MSRLCELALKYDTDKCPQWRGGTGHSYTPFYTDLLAERKIKRVLEIGICTGASLRMWEEYFPEAEIVGVDVVTETFIKTERIHSVYCDQSSEKSLAIFRADMIACGWEFDLIIDDGSHLAADQILSARWLMQILAPGGLYIIEDVQLENKRRVWLEIEAFAPRGFKVQEVELETARRSDDRLIVIERPV